MPYRIKGTLKLPSGQPAVGVDIEFISRRNYSPLLMDLSSIIKTTSTGAYDITLEYGEYAVVVYWGCNQPSHIGKLFVFSDTAIGLDLQTLLQQADWQPATPEYIQQIQDWLAQASASASQAVNSAAEAKVSNDAAKSEADRSKAEADRASQAVIDSAVPFPDVWIPFNDSLRMFAGYGREVKVGDDVVARMVNFERSTTATYIDKSGVLRTAAINEPRFEKQGLLIEGQSTNLCQFSNDFSRWNNNGDHDLEVVSGGYTKFTMTSAQAGGRFIYPPEKLVIGKMYTLSFWAYSEDASLSVRIGIQSEQLVRTIASTPTRHSITITATQESSTLIIYNAAGRPCVFFIRGMQLEELPFASSYIPTNGASVTRAADKVTIPRSNNDCAEWYSGSDKITPIVTSDTIQLVPPAGKYHLRNVKGFFTALTEAQKKALK